MAGEEPPEGGLISFPRWFLGGGGGFFSLLAGRLARALESILAFDGRLAIVEPLIDAGRTSVLLLLTVRLPVGGTGRGRLVLVPDEDALLGDATGF